eukprot:2855314-Alexandrium_andersonii.AAC.1
MSARVINRKTVAFVSQHGQAAVGPFIDKCVQAHPHAVAMLSDPLRLKSVANFMEHELALVPADVGAAPGVAAANDLHALTE